MVPFIQFGMFRFLPFFPQPKGRFHRYIIYQYIYIYIYSVYIYTYVYMIQLLRSWEYRSAKQLLFDMGHHEEVVGLNGDGVSKLPPDHDLLEDFGVCLVGKSMDKT